MLADMHCHYPMHVVAGAAPPPLPGCLDEVRADLLTFLAERINHDDDWRVSFDELIAADVRAVFSVLYEPFAEFDLDRLPGTEPESGYFDDLLAQLERVEADLAAIDPGRERHEVVRTGADLERVTGAGKTAFMHCVEGGFHLGAEVEEVEANVAELARRGVVYVTLAHLFWRGIATSAPALPFLGDDEYKAIFRHRGPGLSPLGEAAVRAMYEHRVLIDLSHMNQKALDATFALLDRLDRETGAAPTDHPVIATHTGYRFGHQEYMLGPGAVERIVRRGGVVGLILARHQLNEGAGVIDEDDPRETPVVLERHIEAIRRYAPGRSNAHVAIGSDLDGFIKPTVAGIETAADLASLGEPLRRTYGEDAERILSGNALRMARWALEGR
jgi:microsomal dipeptidase-like Zn-dependent dipeptidase